VSNPGKDSKKKSGAGAGQPKPFAFRANPTALFPVNYSEIDAGELKLALDAVTRAGGAIMFGLTSDGGAFSVMVLSSEGKAKEYPHTKEEFSALMGSITEYYV
jgi:hypothetical protein